MSEEKVRENLLNILNEVNKKKIELSSEHFEKIKSWMRPDKTEEEKLLDEWNALADDQILSGIKSMHTLNPNLYGNNEPLIEYVRLPGIEKIADNFEKLLAKSLREFYSEPCEVYVEQIATMKFIDRLNSTPLPAMFTVFNFEEWNSNGLFIIDSALIYATIDILFGGRKGVAAMRIEGRSYTPMEHELVKSLCNVFTKDLSKSFSNFSPVTINSNNIETNPRFTIITHHHDPSIVIKYRIDMNDRYGHFEIVIPISSIAPAYEELLKPIFPISTIWQTILNKHLLDTKAKLTVYAESKEYISDIVHLSKGSKIEFDTSLLLSKGIDIAKVSLGTKGSKRAICIEEMYKFDRNLPSPFTKQPEPKMIYAEQKDQPDLSLLSDVKLNVKVVVGSTNLKISEILKLTQGIVLELDKLVGEPVEVFAEDKLIAFGEIVVIGEKIGVQLTQINSLT